MKCLRPFAFLWLSLFLSSSWARTTHVNDGEYNEEEVRDFFGNGTTTESGGSGSGHTNNWAVLVSTSRYWFNYRHMANALGMYRTVKRLGIPDSNIILMLADDAACNPRNAFPASVYANPGRLLDLYGENVEVDYRGYEVTVEAFIRVLTGRHPPTHPRSKRLLSDASSNILIYMTGHGGDGFLKFQDNEEISSHDVADAVGGMWEGGRYSQILFMIDTCQATSMYAQFYSPNIIATGSSQVGENSYSYQNDPDIGVAVIDSYTHYVLEWMEGIGKTSRKTLGDLFASYNPKTINSTPGVRSDLFPRPLNETLVTDFFGGVSRAEVVHPESHPAFESSLKSTPSFESTPSSAEENSKDEELESTRKRTQPSTHEHFEQVLIPSSTPTAWSRLNDSLRAWGSLAVIGGLVGWVIVK